MKPPRAVGRRLEPLPDLVRDFHALWQTRPFSERHLVVDEWCATSEVLFYQQNHTYLEAAIRLTTLWLRKMCPRTPEQIAELARVFGRKKQDVRLDLDALMVARQRAFTIAKESADKHAYVADKRTRAVVREMAVALADEDDDE